MSLRLRLALWYGGCTAVVILLIAAVAYVVHGRALYDDVDRALADDAAHFAPVLNLVNQLDDQPLATRPARGISAFVRLYDERHQALGPAGSGAPTEIADTAPPSTSTGTAYPDVLHWLPGGGISAPGAFVTAPFEGRPGRVRIYELPITRDGEIAGYVRTWASLVPVDRSVARFRLILTGLGGAGVLAVVTAGLLVSGPALRPAGVLIRAADGIARSRDLRRRVPEQPVGRRDELGELARTFNRMLDALESSHLAQQRFLADAAHELRAPLTVIRGNIELLDRIVDMDPADRREAVGALHDDATRLARLVDELLQLARSDAGQSLRRQPIEFHDLVMRAAADLRALLEGERVSVDRLEPAIVLGDRDRLRQLLSTLLDNARKYTPPPDAIRISLERQQGAAVFTVEDDGIGVAAVDLPHVFDRFYRADAARSRDPGGTGLGLAIARAIVEQHGGEISIRSAAGRGTAVTVRLPLWPDPRASGRDQPALSDASAPGATFDPRHR